MLFAHFHMKRAHENGILKEINEKEGNRKLLADPKQTSRTFILLSAHSCWMGQINNTAPRKSMNKREHHNSQHSQSVTSEIHDFHPRILLSPYSHLMTAESEHVHLEACYGFFLDGWQKQ